MAADLSTTRLLSLANALEKEGCISTNGKALFKRACLRRDKQALAVLSLSVVDPDGAILETVNKVILGEAARLHDALFADCSLEYGKSISVEEREATGRRGESSLTYGEVDLYGFAKVLRKISPKKGQTFYDLGSGTGKAVFAARILYDFSSCRGVELLEGLHGAAQEVLRRFDKGLYRRYLPSCSSSTNYEYQRQRQLQRKDDDGEDDGEEDDDDDKVGEETSDVELVRGSLLDFDDLDWSSGDVVFANSTCFDVPMMAAMSVKASALKPGAYFITFTKSLHDATSSKSKSKRKKNSGSRGGGGVGAEGVEEEDDEVEDEEEEEEEEEEGAAVFEMLESKRYRMSWGAATVCIHRRRNLDGTAFCDDDDDDDDDGGDDGKGGATTTTMTTSALKFVPEDMDFSDDDDDSDDADSAEEEGTTEFSCSDGDGAWGSNDGDDDDDDDDDADDSGEDDDGGDDDESQSSLDSDGYDAMFEVSAEEQVAYDAALEAATSSHECRLFNSLFAKWSKDVGRKVSEGDKLRRTSAKDDTLTYGEVMFPTFSVAVMERVKALGGLGPTCKVFTDVGCGTAKPVFAAALVHPFVKCRGVELLKDLCSLAKDIAQVYVDQVQPLIGDLDPRRSTEIEILEGDAFSEKCAWGDSDLVFANATCFSADMWKRFEAKCDLLKHGAFVVTTTSRMHHSSQFEVVEKGQMKEDWGFASLFIHKKKHLVAFGAAAGQEEEEEERRDAEEI